jgi:KDO2-lipid IV(A) lauroyltransferase
MLQALRALRAGRNLAFLIDQDARRDGIFVDFLGKPASTTASPARLAYATGAPIAFMYARRLGRQSRFQIVIADVIWPRQDAEETGEVFRMTQRMSRDLEEVVTKWPTEWMWMHRRWKTYPGKYRAGRQTGARGENSP